MKKIILTTCILFASFAWAEEKTVPVDGMVCAFCAQGIEKAFKAEDAVESIDVQLKDKFVKIKFKEGKSLADDRIAKILKDAGYTVGKSSDKTHNKHNSKKKEELHDHDHDHGKDI